MKKPPKHISGKLHVSGRSRFIADEPALPNQLYIKLFLSPIAHATIVKMDVSVARSMPGIAAVITHEDIPGANMIGHVIKDEPLFPSDTIMYIGQPLAIVLSHDSNLAEEACKAIILEYQELKPVLDIDEADKNQAWYVPERRIECGNIESAIKKATFKIEGSIESSGQEHFYMETQRCRAIPGEGEQITLFTATQSTMEVQEVVSHVLGIPAHNIIIEVPRLGGAFGGKERNGTIYATLAALAAYITKCPVELVLTRDEDMLITGKRHPFKTWYQIGYEPDGKITALDVQILANGGAYADLSIAILERAMFHIDNAYYIPNARIRGRACRTNLPPNTAFRGFGAPQGIFVIESLIEKIAGHLKMDSIRIRKLNAYGSGEKAPYQQTVYESVTNAMLDRLNDVADYEYMKSCVSEFNLNNDTRRQGIGIVPVKFGISFTTALLNQGSALIWIYIDGSVSVSTGGIEMGQELTTKVAIVVAHVLGVPVSTVRVESSNSQRVGNASPTAASTGSDINGNAARIAAEKIRSNLLPAARELLEQTYSKSIVENDIIFEEGYIYVPKAPEARCSFADLIRFAYSQRIPLAAYGYYKTPDVWFDRDRGIGQPFYYYVYGCALSRVEIDLMTGEHTLLDTFIVHENARSLSPEIDRGQVIGAFIQSYGWCAMEEMVHNPQGRYLSVNPSTYKIPGIRDLPQNLVVELLPSNAEHASVLGSKATGEPPFIYGLSVFFAIQNAIKMAGSTKVLSFPATPEAVLKALDRTV